MADGEARVSAASDIVELEAMGKDGLSWHPCQVSLCSRGQGIRVLYGNNLEEMIINKQEIFARIRVRSTPLEGDDCSSIKQGDHVLATESLHVKGVFYDARVEKAIHVRHSKRTHCRCSFTIKWLHHTLPEEALTVPASAIMKLATTSIDLHPTISAFFSMQEPSNAFDADRKNWEMDINVLLEQQIKEISTSTEVPRDKILKDFVSGPKVDLKGKSHGWDIKASFRDPLGAVSFLDKLDGFNGSENKQPVTLGTPPTPTPSIQEELRGNRFLLNPLAARAALASLRSESPQSSQLKGDMTGQHSTANLMQRPTVCSFSSVDCSSNAEDFSLKTSAANVRSITKKLFPTSSPTHTVELSNLSCGAQINEMKKKNKMGEKKTLSADMRLTRSRIQRDNGMHETSQMTNNNETQSRLTGTHRVTRSRVKGAEKIEANDYHGAGRDHVHNECMKLETFPHSAIAPENCLSDNLKAVASPINGQISTRRVTRSRDKRLEKTEVNEYITAVKDNMLTGCTKPSTSTQDTVAPKFYLSNNQKAVASSLDSETSIHSVKHAKDVHGKDGILDVNTQKDYLIQDAEKHNNPKRPKQSAASKVTENSTVQLKLKQRKRNSTESDVLIERLCIDRSLTSLHATNNNEQSSEEAESGKRFTRANTAPKGSGSHHSTRHKSASLGKPETRFSPRLRFLPRTRSQHKA
ncbi:uncharacterized protein LOC130997581 isoform X2 [Salvia miltiorrhiza]|uniref:uncharacterized protein LOC130997581 isoform X2 n=1 Tax=Salvia miltiorrhiza TaxID=226208 RepID=UPI0025AB7C15|nr:uncharacterized protein LOC130997581 isoform X2 [Salvia miltiorrhiza]XP_057778930.1 uncharacterized protein LOC130997581 isoform X2 [Salvia miltiorrhiza]